MQYQSVGKAKECSLLVSLYQGTNFPHRGTICVTQSTPKGPAISSYQLGVRVLM